MSALQENAAFLMTYARILNLDKLKEEMLITPKLKTDTQGETIFFKKLQIISVKNILLTNIMASPTDGAGYGRFCCQ